MIAETPHLIVSTLRCRLGEGPLWHPQRNVLVAVDIPEGRVHTLTANLVVVETFCANRPTTAVTWQPDGSLLLFHDQSAISRLDPGGEMRTLFDGFPEELGGLFNDVIADRLGRLLCGTQPVEGRLGRLYSLSADREWRVLLDDVHEPNGLGFSPAGTTLYFSDSGAGIVWQFDYDLATGELARRREFLRTEAPELPDGLTVDESGCLWIALWNGGRVVRVDPTGTLLESIDLPARLTTSVAFGGPSLDTLYVTSARGESLGSHDGAIFAVRRCGVRGRPEFPSRLGL